jgi:hypothetical protein
MYLIPSKTIWLRILQSNSPPRRRNLHGDLFLALRLHPNFMVPPFSCPTATITHTNASLGTTSSPPPQSTFPATPTPGCALVSNTVCRKKPLSPWTPAASSASPFPRPSPGHRVSTVSCASRASGSSRRSRATLSPSVHHLQWTRMRNPNSCFISDRTVASPPNSTRMPWRTRIRRSACLSTARMAESLRKISQIQTTRS